MASIKHCLWMATFGVALSLELAIAPSFSAQREQQGDSPTETLRVSYRAAKRASYIRSNNRTAKVTPPPRPLDPGIINFWELAQTFRLPDRGAPPKIQERATRPGASCVSEEEPNLTLLVPDLKPEESSPWGLTIYEFTTFFGYIPETSASQGELQIWEPKKRGKRLVYSMNFDLPERPGIVSISLSDGAPPLEVGKQYQWSLTIVCDADNRSNNPTADGWIERVEPSPRLADILENARPIKLYALYAEEGLWYDALASLAEMRRHRPDEANLADWKELLRSAGLTELLEKPLRDR